MPPCALVVGPLKDEVAFEVERLRWRVLHAPRPERVAAARAGESVSAVVVTSGGASQNRALQAVEQSGLAREVPVLLVGPPSLLGAEAPGWALRCTPAGLGAALQAGAAQAGGERDARVRRRLELLKQLIALDRQATPRMVSRLLTGQLKELLRCASVALLKVEGQGPRRATLLEGDSETPVDLAVSPMLRKVVETQHPVSLDGTWVHPVQGDGEGLCALVLRRSAPLEREEAELVDAVALALQRHAEARKVGEGTVQAREALEAAYLERYKELTEANKRLQALDRKKNELLAVLSHDLRAPLNVVLGQAYLVLTDDTLPASHRASLEAIRRTGKKILELVENLLEKSRADAGPVLLYTKTMDVAETVQETCSELQILAEAKGVRLRVEAPVSLPVLGDEQKIRQVLQNLVMNALSHAQGATEIIVTARARPRPDGDAAQVEVWDNGRLQDPNQLLMAFERSHGLGLAICRDYVERHRGEIWAEAPPEGGGRFVFTLPLKEQQARTSRPPAPAPAAGAPLVLVVEDDPVFSRACVVGLSGHYRVELARDGDEGVQKARALQPDVILMDVFMPRRDGLDALRELKQTPSTADIPVLLMSGHPELEEKLRSVELEAELVAKPVALSVLAQRLSHALQKSPRARLPGAAVPGSDAETGLFDQLGLVMRLEGELARSVRYGRPLTLALLRPSSAVEGRVGACAAALREALLSPDVVGHLGQGVFAIILPETDSEVSRPTIARLCALLENHQTAYSARVLDVPGGASTPTAEALLEQLLA